MQTKTHANKKLCCGAGKPAGDTLTGCASDAVAAAVIAPEAVHASEAVAAAVLAPGGC